MYITDWGYLAFSLNEEQETMVALSVKVDRPTIIQGPDRRLAPIPEALLYHFGALSTEEIEKNGLPYRIGWLTHTFPNHYDKYEEFFNFLVEIEAPFYAYFEYGTNNSIELEYKGSGHKLWTRKNFPQRDQHKEEAQQKIYEIRSWSELEDLYIRPRPPYKSIF